MEYTNLKHIMTNEEFAESIKADLQTVKEFKTFKSYDWRHNLILYYEKRDDGLWHDVTLREQEKERYEKEIVKTRRQLLMMQKKATEERQYLQEVDCEDN